jgi:hypothetical protein
MGINIESYHLEVEYLLAWFPVRVTAHLKEPRMRGGVFTYNSKDKLFLGRGTWKNHVLAQGGFSNDDPIGPLAVGAGYAPIGADIGVGVNYEHMFFVVVTVSMEQNFRSKTLVLPPSTQCPLVLNVRDKYNSKELQDTAVALQIVMTTSPLEGIYFIDGPWQRDFLKQEKVISQILKEQHRKAAKGE